ncbi:MAG: GNAT family N-acetyltransferase [Nigerium sp.]|nr:GNAT family N-acetyltransferase [Nigerium sp.]
MHSRDDVRSIEARLDNGLGYLTLIDDRPVGVVMVARQRGALRLGRVCVLPEHRRLGVASFTVDVVLEDLAVRGRSACNCSPGRSSRACRRGGVVTASRRKASRVTAS